MKVVANSSSQQQHALAVHHSEAPLGQDLMSTDILGPAMFQTSGMVLLNIICITARSRPGARLTDAAVYAKIQGEASISFWTHFSSPPLAMISCTFGGSSPTF